MEEFKVTVKRLQNCGNDITNMSTDMRNMASAVRTVRSSLRSKIVREEEIGRRLKDITDAMEQIDSRLTQYGNKAVTIGDLYSQAEQRIVGASAETVSKAAEAGAAVIGGVIAGGGAGGAMTDGGGAGGGGGGTGGRGPEKTDDGDPDKEIAWIKGGKEKDGKIFGVDSHGEIKGELVGASYDTKLESGLQWEEEIDENGNKKMMLSDATLLTAGIVGEAHFAKGSASGNIGLARGEVNGTVGKLSAEGSVTAALIKDGKLAPQLDVKAEASAVAAEGDVKVEIGSENNNIHAKAEGKAGVATASAEAGIGKITYETKTGETQTGYGVKGEVGAEAYLAEGKVSGGINIFGIQIDAGVGGKLGGAGASAGGYATTGGVGGSVSLGFLAGVELDLNIDWSGFKWGW